MEFKDYYDILGVPPEADKKAIKTAYRRLARKYHPDVSKEKDAEKQFKNVSEAYEVLGSDEKRAEYDQLRKYGRKGESFSPPPGWQGNQQGFEFGNGDFSEFFESVFGGGFQQSRGTGGFTGTRGRAVQRGRDIETDLPVFLEDTLKEDSKTIEYRLPRYDESGRAGDTRKTLKVKIPRGVVDGQRIRVKGQGEPGFGDAGAGDLYLRIKLVPHPLFQVIGHDLEITVPVAPWEAALGATVKVPTLAGKIKMTVAPGTQTGSRLRVKGKGLATAKGSGDLYVVLKVVMPDKVSAAAETLWQQLASEHDYDPRRELETGSKPS